MKRLLFSIPLLLISCQPCVHAETITDSQAVKCVLGEYESGTIEEMTATAEALFNRGTTKGVYGCKAVNGSNSLYFRKGRAIPSYAVKRAVKAVQTARNGSNLVNGATFWESTDFKRPYWAKGMVKTATIGKHEYFKGAK